MAKLEINAELKLATMTMAAIDAATLEKADNGFRPHLGASLIGRKCERELWYSFRWATRSEFPARILRLFKRGHNEEHNLNGLLRDAGVTVHSVDPQTGRQFSFGSGHFGGSMDAAGVGIPDAPQTWHAIEHKTHSDKSFQSLKQKGVQESKPEHYAQMQCYMSWSGMNRALYMAVNKNDDDLYLERIDYDAAFAKSLFDKAERIIFASEPPQRISDKPDWFECKFCDHHATCHGTQAPAVTCRSCLHSTPERAGAWTCARHGNAEIPVKAQREGCQSHRYIPAVIHWARPVDAGEADNWVRYELPNGKHFVNGQPPHGVDSVEIFDCQDKNAIGLVGDGDVQSLRADFGGKVVR